MVGKLLGYWGLIVVAWGVLAACKQGEQGPPGGPGEGAEGPPGEPGDPGLPGDPSISSVLPGTVYRQHDVNVTISGFATEFDEASEPTFGEGIEVVSLEIVSPTALLARLTITQEAPLGPRDVVIGDLTYENVFTVEDPLTAHVVPDWGTPLQGSIVQLEAIQHDVSRPLSGFPRVFLTDGEVSTSDGITQASSSYALAFLQFIDVDAPTGMLDAVVLDGPTPEELVSSAPAAIAVGERSPIQLAEGVTNGTTVEPRGTTLFALPSPSDRWVRLAVEASALQATPAMFVLPDTSFDDRIRLGASIGNSRWSELTILARAGNTPHVVVWDSTVATDYEFSVSVSKSLLTAPIAARLDELGQDWYYLTAAEGEVIDVAIGDGFDPLAPSYCGLDFAAKVEIWSEKTGTRELEDFAICPGYFHIATAPDECDPIYCLDADCDTLVCLDPLVSFGVPSAGGYFVRVVDSPVYSGPTTFDYSIAIEVSTP